MGSSPPDRTQTSRGRIFQEWRARTNFKKREKWPYSIAAGGWKQKIQQRANFRNQLICPDPSTHPIQPAIFQL
ncbi:MAG: hypothetical protein ACRC62_35635 [Microcoleus sp.]